MAAPDEPAAGWRDELLIGGTWRRGRGELLTLLDPATGKQIAQVHAASPDDVDVAVRAAAGAAADSAWLALLPHERAEFLYRIADGIDAEHEYLARLQTANTGKTLAETRALVGSAASTFRFFAAALTTFESAITPPRGRYLALSCYEPIGVVAAITPWNSPIASEAQKIAPALAAGNAVVVKPAEWTPLIALALARIVERAGLPPGLLSVLAGTGPEVGAPLVAHPLVGKVSFTGGTAAGRSIGAVAAERIIPVSLELGGKSPTIVLDDADVTRATEGILFGVFSSSGQSCVAGSRLFVPSSRYDDFVGELAVRAGKLRVGPGTEPDTQVGPLVTAEHRDRVASMVQAAVAGGARVRCGGGIPDDPRLAAGSYYLPTILDGVDNSAPICQQEVFGPVLVVLPYEDEDDLVAQANGTEYGLACGIWTENYRRALDLARRISAGTVWVNTYKQFSISTPFGGTKASGIGREKGRDGITAYLTQKSIFLGLDPEPIPWAT